MINQIGSPARTLLLILVAVIAPQSAFAFQDEQDSVLQGFGRMLGRALGGAPVEAPVANFRMIEADAPPQKVAEKDKEEFQSRLAGYSNAMLPWVIQVCDISEADQEKVRAVFEAEIPKHLELFSSRKNVNRNQGFQQEMFSKAMPVLFCFDDAAGPDFRDAVLEKLRKSILSPDQIQKLQQALDEREAFRLNAIAGSLTAMVDKDLFLTDKQRQQMVDQLVNSKTRLKHSLYSFQPQSYYMPYESLSTLISRASVKDILDPVQRKRLTDLSGADPNNSIVFQAAEGVEAWHNQMHQMARKQRDLFLRAASVRIAWYEKELSLTPEQVRYLTDASKGATLLALDEWKESTQQTMDQMEEQMAQMGGNFGFGAQSVDTKNLDANSIWTAAVKLVCEETGAEKLEQRKSQQTAAFADCLIALFDEELWLTPEQRTSLKPLFEDSLPRKADPVQYQEYIRELVLLAHPLFKVSKADQEKILSEPQQEVWKLMETYFTFQKNNNYVQIPLRNQGGSFGFMLAQ